MLTALFKASKVIVEMYHSPLSRLDDVKEVRYIAVTIDT